MTSAMSSVGRPGIRELWQYTVCCPIIASASVSRSIATASRPRPWPIIVSWTSSASRCLSIAFISPLLRRLGGTNLDAARQTSRRMLEQVDDHLRDVVRGQFPFRAGSLVSAEIGVHRTGHHVGDANAVVADLLHQCLRERIQS